MFNGVNFIVKSDTKDFLEISFKLPTRMPIFHYVWSNYFLTIIFYNTVKSKNETYCLRPLNFKSTLCSSTQNTIDGEVTLKFFPPLDLTTMD